MKTSRIAGFSLVESLVVLSILATGLTLAAPSWNESSSKRELVGASDELSMFLSSGRSLAVKHNRDVAVSLVYQDSTNWCVGLTEGGTVCDCTVMDAGSEAYCAVGGVLRVLDANDLPRAAMTSHSDATSFVFDRVRGTLVRAYVESPHHFNLLSANGKAGLQVGVSATGSTFVCSWLESESFPAYRSCEPEFGDPDSPSREGALFTH